MRRTSWAGLVLILVHGFVSCPAWSAQSSSGEELQRLLITRLLLDSDPEHSRLGARSIAQLSTSAAKQSLSDLTAEHLIELAKLDPTSQAPFTDAIGWHVNVLAANVGRYRSVLKEARERYKNERVLNRIITALETPDAGPAEEYKLSDSDFTSIKTDADRQWAANRRQDRSRYSSLETGTKLGVVLAALGSPDDITATTMRVARWGRTDMLTLHYAGAGMVLLNIDRAGTGEWMAFEFVDELFDVNAVYIGQHFGVAQAISGVRGTLFRDYLIYNTRLIAQNPEFLPVLEQRVISVPDPADKFELDAMLRCVRLIYRYGSLEAMDALRRIDKAVTEKHVQKEARSFATKLQVRSTTGEQPEDAPEEDGEDTDAP